MRGKRNKYLLRYMEIEASPKEYGLTKGLSDDHANLEA